MCSISPDTCLHNLPATYLSPAIEGADLLAEVETRMRTVAGFTETDLHLPCFDGRVLSARSGSFPRETHVSGDVLG